MTHHLTCDDFPDAPQCCDSCHEDQAVGYELTETELVPGRPWKEGLYAYTCCFVATYLDSLAQKDRP